MSSAETLSRAHANGAQPQAPRYASRADRPTSFDLADIPVPSGREEDWRFTPMRRIAALFDPAGYGEHDASARIEAPAPARVERVGREDPRVGSVGRPGDRTAVVSWNTFHETTALEIPRGADIHEPIVVRVGGDGTLQSQHLLIEAGEQSHAIVILSHRGSAKLNQTVEISTGDASDVTVVSLQEWDDDAVHASNQRISIGRDATFHHIAVTLGGALVRVCLDAKFRGPGSKLTMLGAYFADADQHLEHRIFVDHATPDCTSRVTYKGALQGKNAHSVWVGDCLIGKQADNTDAYELNRNLVLTGGAKADSVPNLEIEDGEIKGAGHATATGRFDDIQLFYLMSRGVSEADARRLVVRGFFAELIEQIDVPVVRDHLMGAIERELAMTARIAAANG